MAIQGWGESYRRLEHGRNTCLASGSISHIDGRKREAENVRQTGMNIAGGFPGDVRQTTASSHVSRVFAGAGKRSRLATCHLHGADVGMTIITSSSVNL